MSKKKKRINLILDEDDYEVVKQLADEDERSMQGEVRYLMMHGILRTQRLKEKLHQGIDDA